MSSPMSSLPHIGYVVTVFPRLSETFILNEIAVLESMGLAITVFSQKPAASDGVLRPLATRAPIVVLGAPGSLAQAAALRDHIQILITRPRLYLHLLKWAIGRGHRSALKKFWRAGRLARECERRGIDHLHAHFLSGNTRIARLAASLTGRSYSLTAHAKDIYATGLSSSKLARRIGEARFAVTVSEHNRAHLARVADPERLVVIRNGVDLENLRFRAAPGATPRIVLAVGRLVPKKGFDTLVEAMTRVVGVRNPAGALAEAGGAEAEAWIVGDGPEEANLRAQIAARGLTGRVKLFGARPHAEVLELMAKASVLAVPSVIAADGDRDGLPTVLPEAMAAGLPVVATWTTGIPELVIDGETGLLVEPGDPSALAAALARVLDEPSLASALTRTARAKVEAEYDLGRNVGVLFQKFAAVRSRGAQGVGVAPAALPKESAPREWVGC